MPAHTYICLVGNKTDLVEGVEVQSRQGKAFMETHQLDGFFETSAKENTGIQEMLKEIAIEANKRNKLMQQ